MTLAFKTSNFGMAGHGAAWERRGGSKAGLKFLCSVWRHGSSRASLFGQVRLLFGILFCCLCLF